MRCVVCSRGIFRRGGGGAPQEMGGCRTRLSGSPTVVMSEIVSKPPSTAACNANEVRVVQLLCVRWAHEVSIMLSANMVSSSVNLLAAMDTTKLASSACFQRKKGRVFTRPAGTFPARKVSDSKLFRRFARLRSAGFRRCAGRSSRSCRLGSCGSCWRCRSSHTGLHVISLNHRLGDVDRLAPPENIALRPGLRGVDDHAESVLLRILHDHRRHLLQDLRGDVLLSAAELFLGLLHIAIEALLSGLDLLLQVAGGIFVQLVALRVELLLQRLKLVVLTLQLSLLGLKLLLQSLNFLLAFVAAENRFLDIDGSDLGGTSGPVGRGRRGARRSCCRCSRRTRRGGGAAGLG